MRCPICRRPVTTPEARPFCSVSCRQVDLARWLDGSYCIAADPLTPDTALNPDMSPDGHHGAGDIARSKEPLCD